jgi:hypothetical protein
MTVTGMGTEVEPDSPALVERKRFVRGYLFCPSNVPGNHRVELSRVFTGSQSNVFARWRGKSVKVRANSCPVPCPGQTGPARSSTGSFTWGRCQFSPGMGPPVFGQNGSLTGCRVRWAIVARSLDARPPVFDLVPKCANCPAGAARTAHSEASGTHDLTVQGSASPSESEFCG